MADRDDLVAPSADAHRATGTPRSDAPSVTGTPRSDTVGHPGAPRPAPLVSLGPGTELAEGSDLDGPFRRGRWVVAGIATTALVGSYLAVRSGRSERFDRMLAGGGVSPLGGPADRAIAVGTDLGSVYGLGGMVAVLALAGRRRAAGEVALAGSSAWVVAQALKPLLPRSRPYEQADAERLVAVPAGSSWPSGHAAVIAAGAGVLAPRLPRLARAGLSAVAGTVGWSRLYVGVHHPSDVVAGLGLGTLLGQATRSLLGRRRRRR